MKIITIYLKTVNSTQTYAKEHASDLSPKDLTCIVAEEQTEGRGQFQRKWISPKGKNLYVTFYFQIPIDAPYLTTLASLMIQSIQEVLKRGGVETVIKHPNDLLLNGKKIAGALCETEFHANHIEIFLGFGLNLSLETKDLDLIDQPASGLAQETGRMWDKKELLSAIQHQFLHNLSS